MTTSTICQTGLGLSVTRAVLANGLRVVIVPERGTGAVAVAVHYAIGYRNEPQGRAGFAHLFEHLMFQGSEQVEKLAHFRFVQAAGGSCNAVTSRDHTCYYQVAPAAALARMLFLEADRMRAPLFTPANLANQVAVIREEIGRNVTGRPYGGLPWLLLPPVLFRSFANTHDGYGAVAELATVTVPECEDFFARYYAPGNAVLTITGDVSAAEAGELAARYFEQVPARPVPAPCELSEPALAADVEHMRHDPLAPLPATVIGWPLAGPDGPERIALTALAAVLADGENARLCQLLVRTGVATRVTATASLAGDVLENRAPDAFVVTAVHRQGQGVPDAVLAGLSGELGRLASAGPEPAMLAQATARLASTRYRRLSQLSRRAQSLGAHEIVHGRAELAWELAQLARAVPASAVASAAAELDRSCRAILFIRPGQARQDTPDSAVPDRRGTA